MVCRDLFFSALHLRLFILFQATYFIYLLQLLFMHYNEKTPRREFFKESVKQTAGLTMGLSLAATLFQSFTPKGEEPLHLLQQVATEKDFRNGVIGPAELSRVTSELGVEKATNKNAHEFAGFELTEAIAVTTVLKDLGTTVPGMTEKAKATLAKIKAAAKGPDFDKAYISAQLENHVFLRDLAQRYLAASTANTPEESQGRHLATLSLAVFKEHVAITQRIMAELGA